MSRLNVHLQSILSGIGLLLVTLAMLSADDATAQTKRALLVGINSYEPPDDVKAEVTRKWRDLEGAVNDVAAMEAILSTRQAFDEVTTLTNEDATREAILSSIEERLVQPSQPGDVALFFYAGHGSQVRNTDSREADGLDETIVPSDAWKGARDIRDKELRDVFNRLLDRGVVVTLIFDSCHSGSITRGIAGGRTRFIEADPRPIADASDPPKPVERGALVISAAQDDEVAREIVDADGLARGVFSWAFGKALLAAAPDETAEALFLRARAMMQSVGASQEPVISGVSTRRRQALVGGVESESSLLVPVVESNQDGTVVLQGGLALGLREATELIGAESKDGAVVRLQITQADGMSRSVAEVLEADDLPEAGDLFKVDRWVSPAASPLRLHVPPAVSLEMLEHAMAVAGALADRDDVMWVEDPTAMAPDHILMWNGAWRLSRPDGSHIDLGDLLTLDGVVDNLMREGKSTPFLFVSLPPFVEASERILGRIQSAARPTELVTDTGQTDYLLMGRMEDESVAYAWVLRDATSGRSTAAAPPRTDWRSITSSRLFQANLLAIDANKLDIIWGWLHLESPPDDGTFPYHFVGFENVGTGERRTAGDTLVVGERYRMVLESSALDLERARVAAVTARTDKRFVYLFIIDRNGDGALLYPPEELGNVENDVSLFSDLPLEIKYPSETGFLFEVGPPVGVDSFFLVTSAEAIPQPGIFNFEGVRTRGPMGGDQTDLSRLFDGLGTGTRGAKQPVPTNWSLERITVRSVEAPD